MVRTILVAAGPPASAHRPAMRTIGRERIRRISDWFSALQHAAQDRLPATLEAALLETRAMVERGQTGLETDGETLGRTAGERLWSLALRAGQSQVGDLAEETHFRPLQQMRAMIQAIGNPGAQTGFTSSPSPRAATVRSLFQRIDDAFHYAARGATTLSFARHVRRGVTLVRILVTGFDPFSDGGPVPPGTVNPSGAAALAMDNTKVQSGRVAAAVEGVVLPVSFQDFRAGMVERIVRPLVQSRQVDAVLTVSQDANIPTTGPLEIERYVVGVHNETGAPTAIPTATPGGLGPAVIEAQAPVEQIAAETELAPRGRNPGIEQPTIGMGITFRFETAEQASRTRSALKLPAGIGPEVTISDRLALERIINSMQRQPNGIDISFRIGGQVFTATVLEGPGGDFLSNEVSYRVLRLLGEEQRPEHRILPHARARGWRAYPAGTHHIGRA